ncbi:MAG: hypothetical protein KY460_10905 [Actinobacteria bacterium]|nr:hypothetical protein [Actinomycetota bacterium]
MAGQIVDGVDVAFEPRSRSAPEAGGPAAAGPSVRVAPSRAAIGDVVAALARGEPAPAAVANHAIVRLLSQVAASPAPVVGVDAVPVGLASEQRIEDYVAQVRAVAEAPANQGRPMVALARFAADVANAQLAAIGVPVVDKGEGVLDDAAAHFVSNDWAMTVDVSDFAPEGVAAPTVADIDPSKLSELGGTVYHEARHAEQKFRQARLLAGRHHAELNPTPEPAPGDSAELLALRVKVAQQERRLVVLRLAIELTIPERIMEHAAQRPLIPLDDPVSRLLGTVVYGLRELTVADLFQPVTAYERAVAAGERGVARHAEVFHETERWWAQEPLEDLVYDRSGVIGSTLGALSAEADKAGSADGMDVDVIRAQREPMKQIVADIDRELKRLKGAPGRETMVELLRELRQWVIEIGTLVKDLVRLENEPASRDRASAIARRAEMVGLLVGIVELHLSGSMYRQLLLEADAYAQGTRVRSTWDGPTAAP